MNARSRGWTRCRLVVDSTDTGEAYFGNMLAVSRPVDTDKGMQVRRVATRVTLDVSPTALRLLSDGHPHDIVVTFHDADRPLTLGQVSLVGDPADGTLTVERPW